MTEQNENKLTDDELVTLIRRVFKPGKSDTALAIIVDVPDEKTPDTPEWEARREMAADWTRVLASRAKSTGLPAHLYLYRNVGLNNADLPPVAHSHPEEATIPRNADLLPESGEPFASIYRSHSILLAPTHFSATAPLKLAVKEHRFRAATMPGFVPAMIPALRLDYGEINRRVELLKQLLDRAEHASLEFVVDGDATHRLDLDLRHRQAHASGGLFPEPGSAGNLPSGESYIVPYEGETEPTRSAGQLPVQLGDEVVIYEVDQNRAIRVTGEGKTARTEAARLAAEPAYGNLAELGLGVLADFGLQPIGQILLDEKLGLHIAFGRSDHFGGQVGAADFSSPEAVVHIDRVYLPATQPRIQVATVELRNPDGSWVTLIKNDRYVNAF